MTDQPPIGIKQGVQIRLLEQEILQYALLASKEDASRALAKMSFELKDLNGS